MNKIDKKVEIICKYFIKAKNHISNDNIEKAQKYIYYIKNNLKKDLKTKKYLEILNEIEIFNNNYLLLLSEKQIKQFSNKSTTNSNEKEILNKIMQKIDSGDIINLENILNTQQINLNILFNNIISPLHLAVKNGDCQIVNLLIKHKANINLLDGSDHTPLELACLEKNPNMINFLSELGVNLKNKLLLRKDAKGKKLNTSNIESALIIKLLIDKKYEIKDWKKKWEQINEKYNIINSNVFNYFINMNLLNCKTGWDNINISNFLGYVTSHLNKNNEKLILTICFEELIGTTDCIEKVENKLTNFLLNLIPLFNLNIKISSDWLLNYELKNLAKIYKLKYKKNFLPKFLNKIWKDYIEKNVISYKHLNNIIEPWIKNI